MNKSILGRAKLKLYFLITGKTHWMPEDVDVRRFIRGEFRENPASGIVLFTLLRTNSLTRVSFSKFVLPKGIPILLKRLEQEPLNHQNVLEVNNCPKPLPKALGVCVRRENLAGGGNVYVLTLFDDVSFPEAILGRIEVRVCSTNLEPMFSVLSGSDYDHYHEKNYHDSWLAEFAVRCLLHLDNNRPLTHVPISQIKQMKFSMDELHNPPEDQKLLTYIIAVLRNESTCAVTTVPLKKIKPFSLDFCLTYPKDTIKWEIQEIKKGNVSPMLVYWNRDHFVMSDDYSAYLAYRFLESESVPVAIIGEFPKEVVSDHIVVGGPELVPPLRIMQRPNYESLAPEIKEWLIDFRLQHKQVNSVSATLAAVAMVLSEILAEESVDEKRIHNFLAHYPIIMDPHGSSMRSELKLGNQYRVDLAIQYALDDKKLLLIELEHPKASIFTAKGRPRAHVTHAIQQVEDWLQWWREHPDKVPKGLDATIPVEGLVVIGRNRDLTDQDKRRLLHLNNTRDVKLITYDGLLEKLEMLIQNFESLE